MIDEPWNISIYRSINHMSDLSFNQSAHIIDMSINFIQIVATFIPIPEKYHKDPFSRYSMIIINANCIYQKIWETCCASCLLSLHLRPHQCTHIQTCHAGLLHLPWEPNPGNQQWEWLIQTPENNITMTNDMDKLPIIPKAIAIRKWWISSFNHNSNTPLVCGPKHP